MSKWKTWEEQGKLKQQIQYHIDKGAAREQIIKGVVKESGILSETVVSQAIDELIADWLVFEVDGEIMVTEWASSSLEKATGKSLAESLLFLKGKGVYHHEMPRYGIVGSRNDRDSAEDNITSGVANVDTIPDSGKVKKVAKAQSGELLVSEVPEGAERIRSAIDQAMDDTFKDVKCEFTVAQVLETINTVSPEVIAKEIGGWIIENVEQFIDNQDTVFRMYLNIASDMGMPVSSLYQRLFLSIYNAEEGNGVTSEMIDNAVAALNALLVKAKDAMEADTALMEAMFKKMVFFYELTGFVVKDGKVQQAMTQKMDGKVRVNILEFDPVSLTATVAQGVGQNKGGVIKEGDEKVVVSREEIPAGFGIELEIVMSPKGAVPLAMY